MKERGILFSAPMVRALLAGTKTQTRRAVKPEGADHVFQFRGTTAAAGADEPTGEWGWCGSSHVVNKHIRCPYGKPGDRLWVREAFRFSAGLDRFSPTDVGDKCCDAGYSTPWAPTQFEADSARRNWQHITTPPQPAAPPEPGKLRPGMFMPRWASRIALDVVGVRVERLQDISEEGARAEGVSFVADGCARFGVEGLASSWCDCPVTAYAALWESINGAGSWDVNPWVWIVEFRRL